MAAKMISRSIGVFQLIVAGWLFWVGILSPLADLFKGYGSLGTFPLVALPSLMLGLVCLFSGYHLLILSSVGYDSVWPLQLVLLLISLVMMSVFSRFGAIASVVNTLCLLLLLHPSVAALFNTPTVLRDWQRVASGGLQRLVIGGIIVSLLGIIFWCGLNIYTAQNLSAYGAMRRLAEIADTPADTDAIRHSLLERLPPGTSSQEITAYLETHQVPRDTFRGGQFVRYQMGQGDILALFSNPPWVFEAFCTQVHYGIRFVMRDDQLEDIIIESYTRCL